MQHLRILAVVLFCGSLAHAYPEVGDKVQWQGNIKLKSGDTKPVHIAKEVVEFNNSTKKWKVKYVATVGDKVTTEFIETAELYSPAEHKKMISNCGSQGGQLEDVIAPAGKYQTCKLTTKNSEGMIIEKWYGDIPFGVVGRNTTDSGETQNPDLNAIARGL